MKKIFLFIAVFVLFGFGMADIGKSQELIPQNVNNLAHDFATCSAFFSVSAVCLRNRPDGEEISILYDSLATQSLFTSASLTDEELAMARYEIAVRNMQDNEMKNNCGRISVSMNKYMEECTHLAKAIGSEDSFLTLLQEYGIE